MDARGITANAWAERAGLPNANAIYNFLSGKSRSLSQATYEKLAGVFGISTSILTGDGYAEAADREAHLLSLFRVLDETHQRKAIARIEELLRSSRFADAPEDGVSSKKREAM